VRELERDLFDLAPPERFGHYRQKPRVWCDKPGFYAVQLRRGGVEVGLKITHGPTPDPETGEPLDRSWWWQLWVNGEEIGEPSTVQPDEIKPGGRYTGREITEADYEFLVAHREWAAKHAPDRPEAHPRAPVDFNTMPLRETFK